MVSVEVEEPITTQGEGGVIAAECKSVTANVVPVYNSQATKPVSVTISFDPTDWLYQDDVSVTENSGDDLTDFQVWLELTAENFDFTKAQDNGEDIRFSDTGGELLPYWIESWDKVGQTAKILIKIPFIPANDKVTIYFYYGNPIVSSTSSALDTFSLFDAFETGDLTTGTIVWTPRCSTESDGVAHIQRRAECSYLQMYTGCDMVNAAWAFDFQKVTPGDTNFYFTFIGSSVGWPVTNDYTLIISIDNYTIIDHGLGGIIVSTWDNDENPHKFEVTRDQNGNFELFYDGVSKGTGSNLLYLVSSYMVFFEHNFKDVQIDNFRVRKFVSPEPVCSIKTNGETVKTIGLNVDVKPAEHKPVIVNIETRGYSHRLIQTKIGLSGEITKTVAANVVRRAQSLKSIQTKIWWNSSKTLRDVQAKVGEPAATKHVSAKVGFPKTTRTIRLETPTGYKEIPKTVKLKVEKYSELVTRIIVADTRQTAYSYITKPIGLDIHKFPYNSRPVRLKLLSPGETTKPVRCDVLGVDWQITRDVSCNVNKSRQIITVGSNVFLPRSETLKTIKTNIWWDTGESTKPVVANVVPTYLGTVTKSVRVNLPTPAKTYRAVHVDTQPTHRWTPVSCDIVNQSTVHIGVRINITNELLGAVSKQINEKIEKYAEHTRNLRARRKVQAKIHYYDMSNVRLLSVSVDTQGENTRVVKLKIHLYSVYGTITDENGDPVKNATVFLYKLGSGEFVTAKTTETDNDGHYNVPEIPYGNYNVLVIKQAHDLAFSPVVINGAHVDVEKNMSSYTVGRDTCLEEIMSPAGDVFRFQVLSDEVLSDNSRITDILLIWGDLYSELETRYRDTDGIFMVESPSDARLTVLHDFWETDGDREEGKDDKFLKFVGGELIPTTDHPEDVSWFAWTASLYYSNFIGFIVRVNSRGNAYTILSTNIGGNYETPDTPQTETVPVDERLPPCSGGVITSTRGTNTITVSPQPPGYELPRPPCITGTHEVLEYCPDGILEKRWRDCVDGEWIYDSQECPIPPCVEGTHEILTYCPDGITPKRWRDCVDGEWVYDSQVCCSPEGAHEVLEYCLDGITEKRWRDCINADWREGSQRCICVEGTHEILTYCPDGITPKRWRDCINDAWVEDSAVCPLPWIRNVKLRLRRTSWFKPVSCNVRLTVSCTPTQILPLPYAIGYGRHPTISGYLLAQPQLAQNSKSVFLSVINEANRTTTKHIACCINHYLAANTKAVMCNISPSPKENTRSVGCRIMNLAPFRVSSQGTLLVIDKVSGYLLYRCEVKQDGFYSFSVPSDKCYILIMSRAGYRSQMQEICIGNTPLVDRSTEEFGGDIFSCTMNCYYYIRGFEFPPLTPLVGGKIYGHVYNSKTLRPICSAFVSVGDYEHGAFSDESGYYEVFVNKGSHAVECSRGRKYKRAEATVVISSDTEQDFYLDPVSASRGFYQHVGVRYVKT